MASDSRLTDSVGSAPQIAARVRAALAYSGLRYEDVDSRTKGAMTAAKLRRIASARQPRGATLDELWIIADTCGVPRVWLEAGNWDDTQGKVEYRAPRFGEGSLEDRLEIVERHLQAVMRLLEAKTGNELELQAFLPRPLPPAV